MSKHSCPGEPGFECSGPVFAKGLCRRCYNRAYDRRHQRLGPVGSCPGEKGYECAGPIHAKGLCRRCYSRHHRQETRDKASDRQYYEENREEVLGRHRRWREENGDAFREMVRRWTRANPEKRNAYQRRRRARKRNAFVTDFSAEKLADRLSMFSGCWMCGGEADTVDHVIALAAGGPHCLSNFRPACKSCNSSKGTKHWSEFL